MNLQQGHRIQNKKGCRFIFKNYHHTGKKKAGDIFQSFINYYYLWNKNPKPKIAYIQFKSKGQTIQCGVRQCDKTPPGVTKAPTTTLTKTPTQPPAILSGDTCNQFIKVKTNNPGHETGDIKVVVPETVVDWEIHVSFKSLLLIIDTIQLTNQNDWSQIS